MQIFDQIYAGLLISLVGNAALFSIKNNPAALAAIIPLIIIAVLYRVAVARTFQRPMYNLSFHAAADLDRADRFYDWIKVSEHRLHAESQGLPVYACGDNVRLHEG